jgi:NAD(P)-dependent dehydrogenase (short-subunit alcohol dehydrogenase family)
MTRLAGKVALVTGASRGIGESIARRLASDGAHVVNASIIDPTYSDVPSITFEHLDVTSPEAAREMIERVAGDHGRLDILVNNAGVEVEKSVPDTSVDEWDHVMSVNVRGVFLMCKFAMEHLERTRGVIINMASVNAYGPSQTLPSTAPPKPRSCSSRGASPLTMPPPAFAVWRSARATSGPRCSSATTRASQTLEQSVMP